MRQIPESHQAARRNPVKTDFQKKADGIRMLIFDVDGVMTSGGITLGAGGQEFKTFHVQDGMGITLARMAGLRVGMLTGRKSEVVERRARELHVDVLVQGVFQKLPSYLEILESYRLEDSSVCYMGDDLLDLPILERVGLPAAPADAREEVRRACVLVTRRKGGEGAVRELVESLLKNQGKWEAVLQKCRTAQAPDPSV
jgi:3-deoxy-D-manno-octulosonate 8-phosphate phosphatase (KDO 8-P phosphatase)